MASNEEKYTPLKLVKYASKDDNAYKKQEVVAGFGAPYLVPVGAFAAYNVWSNTDLPWSLSPPEVTNTIPYIQLIEYRLKYSSELLSLINSARGFQEAFNRSDLNPAGQNEISKLLGGTTAIALGLKAANSEVIKGAIDTAGAVLSRKFGPLGGAVTNTLGNVFNAAGTAAAGFGAATVLSTKIQNSLANPNALLLGFSRSRTNSEALLDPYTGLYYATPTNISYTLPYISIDNMVSVDSKWSEPGKEGPISRGFELAKKLLQQSGAEGVTAGFTAFDLAMAASETAGFGSEPGASREKIKGFSPSDTGDSVTINFFLYNTINSESLRANWEFLYVLNYQNLPNRRSINLLDPPCVYEVNIPGYKRFPIAAIEKLKVENVGLTRYVNINTGEVSEPGGAEVKMVPEAYKVSITVRSLLTATQNLFKWSDGGDSVVNVFLEKVGEKEKGADDLENELKREAAAAAAAAAAEENKAREELKRQQESLYRGPKF